MNIKLPLTVEKGRLSDVKNLKISIDAFLDLLLCTPRHSCPSDPSFGFVFNNLRFEIFNEEEGVVFNSDQTEYTDNNSTLYEKKLSGSSKNLNTFASELCDVIMTYEHRLKDVNVSMTYKRDNRYIYVLVKGLIGLTQQDYLYSTSIKVWN
ncbi:MAG: hypothetical protein RR382_01140 [Tannerellaceae bacterium]